MKNFSIEKMDTGTATISIELDNQTLEAFVDWSYEVDFDHNVTITIESVYTEEQDVTNLVCVDTLAEELEAWSSERLDLEAEFQAAQSDYYYDSLCDR